MTTVGGPSIERFSLRVEAKEIEDLRWRLTYARIASTPFAQGWERGVDDAYLRELINYWKSGFDWYAQEHALNDFDHYRAQVRGLNIHFIWQRGKGLNPKPLILTHGWPSTFYEMHKVIPMLTDPASFGGRPEDSFDVIVPSLPGYGYSDWPANDQNFSIPAIADLWKDLMVEQLGYDSFFAHGGDIGSGVTSHLALRHPTHVKAIHITAVRPPYLGEGTEPLDEEELEYQKLADAWTRDENGYGHIQGTKPMTLARGLNDSPTGLAAWIIEKYRSWSDCDGNVERRFTKDELLTNITIYWLTQTIASSFQPYVLNHRNGRALRRGDAIIVPTAFARTREPIDRAPLQWAQRSYKNITHFHDFESGGHFMALEEPMLLVRDLQSFFSRYR